MQLVTKRPAGRVGTHPDQEKSTMNYSQLTENERYQISILLKLDKSQKTIAQLLGRHPSTIGRELKRNTGKRGYRPKQAQSQSDKRRSEAPKYRKVTDEVANNISLLIRKELSPQQVAGYLAKQKIVSLHHETIYQLIYADKASDGDLHRYLRIASKPYRKRYGSNDRRGKIKNRRCIEDRPAVVDRRHRIGDWEGDTIIGKNRSGALLTMVERKTLYTLIVKLTGKNAELLAEAAIKHMTEIKDQVKTITLDNGLEFSAHEKISRALEADIYFAHAYASWERGTNENTNGLIRQYFPKGTDFNDVTDEQVAYVMDRLNNRPRATRQFRTPNELFLGLKVDLLAV